MEPEVTARPAPRRVRPARRGVRSRLPLHLSLDEEAALGLWAAAHLALFTLVWAAAWVYRDGRARGPLWGSLQQWDASLLQGIAAHGYYSGLSTPHSTIFFPGYPLVLAAVHLVLRNWVLSELAVSAVAGCFAVVSLARLAGNRRAVPYLLTMPAFVFLMVGYTECLFLALAIPAWRSAVLGRWKRAALLAGLSGLVRPDALFLIPALVVMALTGPPGRRLVNAAIACCALAGPALYEAYLTATSGWDTWLHDNQAGWNLHLVTPVSALRTTWYAAFEHPIGAHYAFELQTELAAMVIMVVATIAFLVWRRWPEAVYCGLAAAAIGTETYYQTGMRTILLLFPVCVALSAVDRYRPWIRWTWLSISVPLAVVLGLMYLSGQFPG